MGRQLVLIFNKKSSYQKWYEQNKQELSQKRKQRYSEDAEYRQRAVEGSRRYRRGERTPPTPADAPISFTEAAERIGIGTSTLRDWRRKELFPEPVHHTWGLWFTENQVSLLTRIKELFQVYRMHPSKKDRLKELRDFIRANWG
jgi:MerR HTH family regulatory protein